MSIDAHHDATKTRLTRRRPRMRSAGRVASDMDSSHGRGKPLVPAAPGLNSGERTTRMRSGRRSEERRRAAGEPRGSRQTVSELDEIALPAYEDREHERRDDRDGGEGDRLQPERRRLVVRRRQELGPAVIAVAVRERRSSPARMRTFQKVRVNERCRSALDAREVDVLGGTEPRSKAGSSVGVSSSRRMRRRLTDGFTADVESECHTYLQLIGPR